ncbi:glycogen synthase [Daejeonella lutea]|uniref:Glycogen synthase n=1 Tax=Daejeonella lutea TaxID=572036 RepID=A0A1T5DKR9_9SPHI|nr:glycogen/starch synthase [Daejeonella lutea]SKB72304.1 starch synthase [Daejeonella lutea]
MDVIHLSAECYPVAKVGGLGDVVGALPKYLNQAGVNASVVLPYYDRKFVQENEFDEIFKSSATAAGKTFEYRVLREKTRKLGFELYLIYIHGLLDRKEIYCYPDEIKQFISYQISFIDWIYKTSIRPDIIHCHDHHTGLVPFLITNSQLYKDLAYIPTICTIHNGQYQGWLGWDKVSYLPSIDLSKAGLLDWNNCINSLAASVKCCWKFTTVSPNYLQELSVNSNGLEKLFTMEKKKGVGIINGIDVQVWNPETDPMITQNYAIGTADEGKYQNKKVLCEEFGISSTKPLVVFIGRLVGEKGAELLPAAIESCLKTFKGKVNFIVLGSGEPEIEIALKKLTAKHKKQYGVYIGYDEELSHRIYAGADFLMMPSRVEPCGLNQLYAVRYGTMPVVHSTGGLKDTVIDVDDDGYGITYDKLEVQELINAVGRALNIYKDASSMSDLRKKMMSLDFSWDRSAKEYIDLYKSLIIPHAV